MTTRELEHFIYLVTRIIRPTITVAVVKIKDKMVHLESEGRSAYNVVRGIGTMYIYRLLN